MADNKPQPATLSVMRVPAREYEKCQQKAAIAKRDMQALMETIANRKEAPHE